MAHVRFTPKSGLAFTEFAMKQSSWAAWHDWDEWVKGHE
jgi:hypothetical protein